MGSAQEPNRAPADPSGERSTALIQAYFENREGLRRFVVARYGEAQADDLMQDLYIKVAGLETIGVIRSPAAYLYRLALNLTHDARRAQTRASARDESWRAVNHHRMGPEDVADIPPMEDVLTARRRLTQLADAINDLPAKTQQVFRMHRLDGKTQAQTAAALGMSQRMVEKRMRAALQTLLGKISPK